MSELRITIGHHLNVAEVKERIIKLFNRLREQHAKHITHARVHWQGNDCTCELTIKGLQVAPLVRVREQEVEVVGDVPFPANLFLSKIEASVRQELSELLAQRATIPASIAPPINLTSTRPTAEAQNAPRRADMTASTSIEMPAVVTEDTPIVFTLKLPLGTLGMLDEVFFRSGFNGRTVRLDRTTTDSHEQLVFKIGPLIDGKAWFAKGDEVLLRHLGVVQATLLARRNPEF